MHRKELTIFKYIKCWNLRNCGYLYKTAPFNSETTAELNSSNQPERWGWGLEALPMMQCVTVQFTQTSKLSWTHSAEFSSSHAKFDVWLVLRCCNRSRKSWVEHDRAPFPDERREQPRPAFWDIKQLAVFVNKHSLRTDFLWSEIQLPYLINLDWGCTFKMLRKSFYGYCVSKTSLASAGREWWGARVGSNGRCYFKLANQPWGHFVFHWFS